jgi:hypothetical protein
LRSWVENCQDGSEGKKVTLRNGKRVSKWKWKWQERWEQVSVEEDFESELPRHVESEYGTGRMIEGESKELAGRLSRWVESGISMTVESRILADGEKPE